MECLNVYTKQEICAYVIYKDPALSVTDPERYWTHSAATKEMHDRLNIITLPRITTAQ